MFDGIRFDAPNRPGPCRMSFIARAMHTENVCSGSFQARRSTRTRDLFVCVAKSKDIGFMVVKHNHFHADRQARQTARVEPLMIAETHVQRIFVVLIVSRKAGQTCSAP
jgi:hypothetical protein